MILEYFMDLDDKSYSKVHTPVLAAKKLPFYFEGGGYYIAGKKYFTERDELNNYLIFFTISGEGLLKFREKEVFLKRGTICIIYCKEYQYYKTNSETPWEFKWLHLNGAACNEYFNLINDNTINIIKTDKPLEISLMFDKILMEEKSSGIAEDVNISNILSSMITSVVLKKLQPVKNSQYKKYKIEIDRVISFIEGNYYEKIRIDDFVNIVHISKYHFLRIFKKYTGLSPYEYLTNYRIKIAKTLLNGSDLSIGEISEKVGYSNVNNFIRDFKKYVGMTPKKYKLIIIL